MRRIYVSALAIASAFLLHPVSSHAQVTGTISGYVQDQGAGMMPGATVTAPTVHGWVSSAIWARSFR